MGLFRKTKLGNLRDDYSPKTIILPKKFIEEYREISDMEHIKDLFAGFKIIEKEVFVNPINKEFKENILIEQNTGIPIMELNSKNVSGLIIEKDYIYFFVEVFATQKSNNKKVRAGIFLVRLSKDNILEWKEDAKKIEIKTTGGEGYGFCFYDFNEDSIKTIIAGIENNKQKNYFTWYLSAISQFLDIFETSLTAPSKFKPK